MNNKNDIYEILNNIKINLDDYEKYDLSDFEKKAIKKKLKNNINHKKKISILKKACVAAIMIALAGTFGSNAMAEVSEKAVEVVSKISSLIGVNKDLTEYTTTVEQSVSDNGITINLKEVILNDNQLIVSYNIISDKKIDYGENPIPEMDIYIDGVKVNTGEGGGCNLIDDYIMEEIITYDLNKTDISGDIYLKMVCNKIRLDIDKFIEGKWEFYIKTNGENIKRDTKEMPLDNTVTLPNGDVYTFKKYTDSIVAQRIYADVKEGSGPSYDIQFKGYDDLGNKVIFSLYHFEDDEAMFENENAYGNIKEDAKYLILTAYAMKYPELGKEEETNYECIGQEFKIDLTKLK